MRLWQESGQYFAACVPCDGNTIIDVGCGRGWATLEFQRRGADVTAMDILPDKHYKLVDIHAAGIAYRQDLDDTVYDIAWCHHTLEHIQDPIAFLARLRQIARELWVIVPHMSGESYAKGHIHRYNMPVLVEHLRRAGWDIEHGKYHSHPKQCNLCATVQPFDAYDGSEYDQDGENWSPYPKPMDAMNVRGANTMTPNIHTWNWPWGVEA